MANEDKESKISTDEEFQSVLEVTRRLREDGHFDFLFLPLGGLSANVEETALGGYLEEAKLDERTFKRVFRREVLGLIFPLIAGMSDKEMVEEPSPFEDFPDSDKEVLIGRRGQVAGLMDFESLREEFEAKMSACTEVLTEMDWQVHPTPRLEGESTPKSPTALVRITGERSGGPGMGAYTQGGRGVLRRLLNPEITSVTLTCTLTDIQYLRQRLEKIERELKAIQEEENAEER